ncbi:MAG: MotA/TolQ/ExbB proton channel family protein [Gammaproteobacteria bacterium]|uniref:MotA/TolQ/ExbB proton channel family protein n=1 Tax=Methylotuvimicrobium sp. TaxID=2822413 RepID=UPI001DAB8A70|nr:MotA/TolQ/ExbB proton channel family protein [Gammaproteobacteria bacterium]
MKRLNWFLVFLLLWANGSVHAASTLDELVSKVRREAAKDIRFDQERELLFIQERDRQQAKLNKLRNELAVADQKAEKLRSSFQENENKLAEMDGQIASQAGELNELFAMVQQNAAEIGSLLDRSMISAQYRDRGEFLNKIIQRESAVSMETLQSLWLVLIDEMHETGKVTRFTGPVITLDGEEKQQTVTRIGAFNAVSEGKFLRFLPDGHKLVELARQPAPRHQRMAFELEEAQDGWRMMAVDPSKGAILALLVESPDLIERINQSGAIGYLILAIGAAGFLIVLWRGAVLSMAWLRIKGQLLKDENLDNNPLGRLRNSIVSVQARSSEILAARLDEAVGQESSRLFFGLTALTVFAAVTPLMGLLGTVIGMIETFQSISLFGTGDPKLMAGGISYALVTTQLGLAVAIPLLLLQSFLHAQANRIVEILDQQSTRLFEQYEQPTTEL